MVAKGYKASAFVGVAVLLLSSALIAPGCKIDPYQYGNPSNYRFPDGGIHTGDASVVGDADVPDGDACSGPEICDDLDNDCNGQIDDVDPANLQDDPANCGSCGNACDYANAFSSCVNGSCQMGDCLPGYWDLNNDQSDGCEYNCFLKNNGVETCNGEDDDCDGQVDEDFDFNTDRNNCGGCFRTCAFFQGNGDCVNGQCTLSGCRGGYVDKDGNPNNGCECLMDLTEGTTVCDEANPVACGAGEVCADANNDGTSHCAPIPLDGCDGVDNDCDGQIDEDAPAILAGTNCYTHPVGCTEASPGNWSCQGACQAGVPTCVGGNVVCGGQTPPAVETCDGTDNNCDGQVDEGYNLDGDPANCGACGRQCAPLVQNGVPGCAAGECTVIACLPGFHNVDASPLNGCEYACNLTNNGIEACGDGVDNDCDGQIDEGFDFQNDPLNCGSCGYRCETNKPFGTQVTGCSAGTCQYGCLQDFFDTNNDLSQGSSGNGCEYFCVPSNGGTEQCDGVDNDCDGQVDEDFDLQNSAATCGSCSNTCTDDPSRHYVTTGCSSGICQYQCEANYYDLNGDLSLGPAGNGCEYSCTQTNGGTEVCDGQDNDCDGLTDEAANGAPLTQPCYTGAAGTENVGPCRGGTQTCSGGVYGACAGQIIPQTERCDGVDNDCDTGVDEDFDVTSDLNNCGACGASCWANPPANTFPSSCSASTCMFSCLPGYSDLNNDRNTFGGGDGCEYTCPVYPPTAEFCNGLDDDCDGTKDNGVTPPIGLCYQGTDGAGPATPGTAQNNPCKGVVPDCVDPDGPGGAPHGWYCQWPAAVEVDASSLNQITGFEAVCDGFDGDCDGVPDDDFTQLNASCEDSGIGICKGTGSYTCNSAMDGVECTITTPGAAPAVETCNNLDDDCDGVVDNGAPGMMAEISFGASTLYVDAYEASRSDADDVTAGLVNDRACSVEGRLPWANVSYDEAVAACAAQGKRLCYEWEWQQACQGAAGTKYPYGNAFDPDACNGDAYDPGCAAPDDDMVLPTGEPHGCPTPPVTSMCMSDYGTTDMSGNVMEWTGTQVGTSPVTYRIRGGSFFTVAGGLTCDYSFISARVDFRFEDLGFRCCSLRYCGNGVVDPGELCDDGNNQPGDGCSADCESDETCGNGYLDSSAFLTTPEQCDDGNTTPGDGCDSSCQLE